MSCCFGILLGLLGWMFCRFCMLPIGLRLVKDMRFYMGGCNIKSLFMSSSHTRVI